MVTQVNKVDPLCKAVSIRFKIQITLRYLKDIFNSSHSFTFDRIIKLKQWIMSINHFPVIHCISALLLNFEHHCNALYRHLIHNMYLSKLKFLKENE